MSEFENAVGAARASDLVSKRWPDASGGTYGGYPAGSTEDYGGLDAANAAIARPRVYDPIVTPDPPGSGENMYSPGPRMDTSVHAHFGQHASSNHDTAASNTCGGDAQTSKAWPDALGGGLGSVADEYKD
jgi:hypothetical protein